MDIENAASSEIPSSCHKKKKRKRQDVSKNVEAKNDCLEGTSSAKDTPLEPPIKICMTEVPRNADATMIEPPTNVNLEKKKKKKKSKTSDDCEMISTDHKSASLENNASVNGTPLEPSINVFPITVPTNVEDTTSEPLANVASEKKKRKKKKKKSRASDDVIDDELISLENIASAKDTTQEPPLDIHTVVVATKAEAIKLEPPASVTSKKKGKKKKSKIIDDFKMNATDHESASMSNSASAKDSTWECPLDIRTAAVTTKADATALETPASATSEKKKKSKITDDGKMNDIDHESASLEHNASVEDTTWEPLVNANTFTIPTTSQATMLDSTTVTSEKKKKKKKKKRSDDFKMDSTAHESASMDALATDTPMEPLVNVCIVADPAKAEEVTTLEPSTNVTSEKKKQKKKRKASSDAKICAADHECAPLENSASVKDTLLEPAVNICAATASTKEMEVTTLEPPTNVTLDKKKKRKKNKASSGTKMDAVDHEGAKLENSASGMNTPAMPSVNFSVITVPREAEAMTLEPPVDVASAKKKKKKKSKTSDDSKLNAIDHETASLKTGVSEEYLYPESVDGIVTVANPERCPSQSLLGKELVVTSEKKKKRKRSRSKDPSTYNIENENLNGAPLKPFVVGSEQRNLEFPNQIINGKTTALENPTPNSDLGCFEEQTEERHRKRRIRKKKNEQAMRQNVHENNDKVLDGTVHPSFKSSAETGPKVEPECAESGLSHKMVEEKEQKKFNAPETDDMDHALQQNVGIPSQGVFVTVSAGLNSTGINEKSPTSEIQSILSNGVNNGSAKKSDGYTEVCDVFESQELDSYMRRKKNSHTKVSKSSDLGDKLQPIEDKDDIDTSSPYLVEENLSSSLDNQFEKTSSRIAVVSEQDADVLIERDSVNHLDNETESGEREELMKMSNLRKPSISNGVFEQKNGGMLVTRHDAFKGESPSCKQNGSSDLSKLDAIKIEITKEEAPLSTNYGEVEDVVRSDAVLKEANIPQMPNALPERSLVVRSKKKLLILDVNGILVEFVSNVPKYSRPHIRISKKGVFKRPYCDDFLQFCFDRFNIALWSSRMKCNMDRVVNFLFNQTRDKLLFCWDQSHCTPTGLNTIENTSKPLVLKELRKVWEKVEPDLPFEKGEYDETNTLLLDDSPYKALRNPAHTAVFPFPYNFENRQDNSLGPGGDLRTYLEGLSLADNVREYVEQNPFGQGAITKSHKQWDFYCKIVSVDEPVSKLRDTTTFSTIADQGSD